jgi:hypothetical protein
LSSAIRLFVLENVCTRAPGYTGTRAKADVRVPESVQSHL